MYTYDPVTPNMLVVYIKSPFLLASFLVGGGERRHDLTSSPSEVNPSLIFNGAISGFVGVREAHPVFQKCGKKKKTFGPENDFL